jgi:hypothetical protein
MNEGRLTNVWCWQPSPPTSGNPWQVECYAGSSRYDLWGPTQQAVQDLFLHEHPELRGVVRWIFEAPPRPKRPGEKPDVAPAVEGDTVATAFHRLVLRAFHRDLHGAKKRWSADEVVTILNDCWSQANAK